MNLKKIAAQDAARWAYAEMFFGKGAGTRRKLLSAEIAHKVENISGYHELFQKAYAKQDMASLAIKAAKERKRIDRTFKVSKNLRALIRGDRRGMSAGVVVIAGVAYFLHEEGLDKEILDAAKKQKRKLKARYAAHKIARDPRKGDDLR